MQETMHFSYFIGFSASSHIFKLLYLNTLLHTTTQQTSFTKSKYFAWFYDHNYVHLFMQENAAEV